MIQKSGKKKLIVKYALVLTIIYAVQMLVGYSFKFAFDELANNFMTLFKSVVPFLMVVIGNLIALYFVMKDKKRYEIKNKYLGWLTFFYCPVGVCILLIHIITGSGEKVI